MSTAGAGCASFRTVQSFGLLPSAAGLSLLAGLLCVSSCKDVTRFSTAPDEKYCGSIIPGPFVRKGFQAGVKMRMSFDADRIWDAPGVISTDDGTLEEAALRPIPALSHDALSTLQFGEGRTRNLLNMVSTSDTSSGGGQSAVVVVSLLENGDAEVRILRGAPLAPGVEARPVQDGPELFGVFPLTRQRGTCGF
jgi:hypothetical protein